MKRIYHIALTVAAIASISVFASCKGNTQEGSKEKNLSVSTENISEKETESESFSETSGTEASTETKAFQIESEELSSEELEEVTIDEEFEVELEESQGIGGF